MEKLFYIGVVIIASLLITNFIAKIFTGKWLKDRNDPSGFDNVQFVVLFISLCLLCSGYIIIKL